MLIRLIRKASVRSPVVIYDIYLDIEIFTWSGEVLIIVLIAYGDFVQVLATLVVADKLDFE